MIKYHKDMTLPTQGEIFVFGSNLAGVHGAGSAKIAHEKFGATWGFGNGLSKQSYAIPTKDQKIQSLPLDAIEGYIKGYFCNAVKHGVKFNPNQRWFITRIGCGLAGYTDKQIAPLFYSIVPLGLCSFPEEWKPFLDKYSSDGIF